MTMRKSLVGLVALVCLIYASWPKKTGEISPALRDEWEKLSRETTVGTKARED
jgi:hypothetical protein